MVDPARRLAAAGLAAGLAAACPGAAAAGGPSADALFLSRAHEITGPDLQTGADLAVAPDGTTYLGGFFETRGDFDLGPGTHLVFADGLRDGYVQALDPDGSFLWVAAFTGALEQQVEGVARAFDGSVMAVGHFRGLSDFDPGPGELLYDPASRAGFVVRLDSAGGLVWGAFFESIGGIQQSVVPRSVAVEGDGSVLVTGSFRGTVDFDPGPGLFLVAGSGAPSLFVLSLSAGGGFEWVRTVVGSDQVEGLRIVADPPGGSVVGGVFRESADFDPGAGVSNLTSAGSADGFALALDTGGGFRWARGFGTAAFFERVRDVAIVGGAPEGPSDVVVAGDLDDEGFLARLAGADGSELWSLSFTTGTDAYAVGVTPDGLVGLAGTFAGAMDFDPGPGVFEMNGGNPGDAFLARLVPAIFADGFARGDLSAWSAAAP